MNCSKITDDLFIGSTPSVTDYEVLRKLGIRLVINMRFLHGGQPKDGAPRIEYLQLRTFDTPLLPIPVEVLMRGAVAALEVMRGGGKVYTHCARGRHRGVAMAAAILIAKGASAEEAMRLIKARRKAADPDAPYVRRQILRFEKRWRERECEMGCDEQEGLAGSVRSTD